VLVLAETQLAKAFQERRKYIHVGSGENVPVFDAPEKPLPIESLPIVRDDGEKYGVELIK
jgi:hypothetical protein